MRTATFLTIIMLTSVILCSPVLASAPSDGSTVTVTDSVSWSGGTFDGEIIIKDGAELHWTGDVSVEQDAKLPSRKVLPFTWMKPTWNRKMPLQHC